MTNPIEPNSPPAAGSKVENPWIEAVKTIGLSAVLAVGIRTYVAEARFIPSGSMQPTLEIDDRLIVDKVSYKFATPKRGDVVVFMPPDAAAKCTNSDTKPKDAFIKRIIGLPGEKVEVKDSQVFINDQLIQENYTKEMAHYSYGPQTVPQNSYLVLGDNRNNSCDGHYWGFVPRDNMIGKAVVRFWPPNRLGGIAPKPLYQQ
jgi:signal peptidase I